ncbi:MULTISPECIES: UV DNA damage repair endonuclease UvsE [Pontibacillus]|uniref:UV DNA damage repair endonuclease UvsE n=1 Tax=Pontibacillus chungwhensis TaxID=265426 RepID=A0ABY8UZV2_9BACI|nr:MULTISPECIES: UV DNA damage repair endonuclease UvsE [Pontibacillus]MCD5324024.1 UV DNA damage repair endonuclease UvsE [Pontibacillus sp. HN14]WIF97914.1 UV DNA damage repair endonuclease UvsE [Pontibacillus chungwhensis]
MRIRFGFVSHTLSLWEAVPAKTLTFKRYSAMTEEERTNKLLEVTAKNLYHTKRALWFNRAAEIPLYRFSSSIVPLATHPEVAWDFITPFKKDWEEIGDIVRASGQRISFHPNQFTVFTSDKPHITENAVTDMTYHYRMLEAMGLENEGFINIHIGGAYGDKSSALDRFHQNIYEMPDEVRSRMTIENDDKTYTTAETLAAAEQAGLPVMFDYHHEMANPGEEDYASLLPRLFKTWEGTGYPPKVHLSSPKSTEKYRAHSDFVDPEFAVPFLKACKKETDVLDVMIEAKEKDRALLQIVEDLSAIRGVKRVRGGEIEF